MLLIEENKERNCKYCGTKLKDLGVNGNKVYCSYDCSDKYSLLRAKIINKIRRRYYAPYEATILEEADIILEREIQKIKDEGN